MHLRSPRRPGFGWFGPIPLLRSSILLSIVKTCDAMETGQGGRLFAVTRKKSRGVTPNYNHDRRSAGRADRDAWCCDTAQASATAPSDAAVIAA